MSLVSTPYFNLACNGRIDNLVNPSCPAVSPGGWDAEKMELAASERGWRPHGKGHLCPACGLKDASAAEDQVAAVAKRRSRKADAPAADTSDPMADFGGSQ